MQAATVFPEKQRTPKRRERRSLAPIAEPEYDLLIIGGGISGASIAHDAALRGLRVALFEKNDFASGTTQATSKLIHGGLRYLRNGELGLVRESLRERRILAQIAPHGVRPEAFLMAVYKDRPVGRWMMGAALAIYGALSLDRNRGVDEEHRLPGSRYLDRMRALTEEPALDPRGLQGAYLYYDYANLNPERLAVEFLQSAVERGTLARNYTRVCAVQRDLQSEAWLADIRDELTGEEVRVRARAVVNAGGPWADYLESEVFGSRDHKLVRSKGVHLVTRKIVRDKTVTLMKRDGTHLFLIPWRGKTLIGTTDTEFREHPDRVRVTREDAERVLADVNDLFPQAGLGLDEIDYFYGGLRPLVDDSGSSYNASRRTEIVDHGADGRPGFFTVLGGKYTTSRALAEKAVDAVANYLPGSFKSCATATTPLPGGGYSSQADWIAELSRRFPEASPRKIAALSGRYGRLAERILAHGRRIRAQEEWRLNERERYYPDEIDFLVLSEGVERLDDLLFRRSGLGTAGPVPEILLHRVAGRAGKLLGWSKAEEKREIQRTAARYVMPIE